LEEDYSKHKYRPGFCPPVNDHVMGQVAIWGLIVNGAYQLITALGLLLTFGTIGVSLGALGLSYSSSSSDKMTVVILSIIGTVLPALTLLVPVASAASAIATSIGLYRGSRRILLYLGAAGAVVGPTAFMTLAMMSTFIMGVIGALAAMIAFIMMVLTITISAFAVAVVSRETALLREEAKRA
jgi:hypothetical protein